MPTGDLARDLKKFFFEACVFEIVAKLDFCGKTKFNIFVYL